MTRVAREIAPIRDDVLESFNSKFSWVPQWEAEVGMAVDGLEYRVIVAERFAGSVALKSCLGDGRKFQTEALEDIEGLREPLMFYDNLLPLDYQILRENRLTIRAIAKHILFEKALEKDKWPNHKPAYALNRKLRPVEDMVYKMPLKTLKRNWLEAYKSSNDRQNFWLQELMNAHVDPKVINALTEGSS